MTNPLSGRSSLDQQKGRIGSDLGTNRDHHLYNNNSTRSLHYTAYPTTVTTQRVLRSLKNQRPLPPYETANLQMERPIA